MTGKQLLKYLAPFSIIGIAVVFVWNVLTHGKSTHPGKILYSQHCAQCHGDKGEGIKALTPPLLKADFAIQHFDSIPCWIKLGINRPITVNGVAYDQPMYPINIDEIQVANIINYINEEFLDIDTAVNSIWVKQQWNNCK